MEKNISFPGAAVAARTDLPRIGELVKKIIRPLEQRKGIEAFQANLASASFGICGGTLREIREVEVVLVSSARVGYKPPSVLSNPVLTGFSGAPKLSKSLKDFKMT